MLCSKCCRVGERRIEGKQKSESRRALFKDESSLEIRLEVVQMS